MGKFTLGFGDKIGKTIVIRDKGEYYCGDYIEGRFYYGKFNGTTSDDRGIWFYVDDRKILVSNTTEIEFKED
jgi:hypothetical protein